MGKTWRNDNDDARNRRVRDRRPTRGNFSDLPEEYAQEVEKGNMTIEEAIAFMEMERQETA